MRNGREIELKILILGGTIFVGRALVDEAKKRGHELTLFHRGKHNAGLFPEVETIQGDRTLDLSPLANRKWDAVIDTCGYLPGVVRKSAEFLKDSVEHYSFISSISVYANFVAAGIAEDYSLGVLEDPTVTEVTGETYGPLKVLCEAEAEGAMPGKTLVIRPGLIVGPNDPTDRFTYWIERVAEGGEVLAPDAPELPVQFIDARDLAIWNLDLIEAGTTGIYNATGPERTLTMGELLETCRTVTQSDASFTWLSKAFLLKSEVAPWSELPLWVPAGEGAGFSRIDCSKGIAAGLTFRPLSETIRDTFAWVSSLPKGRELKAGLKREKESAVLAMWKSLGEV